MTPPLTAFICTWPVAHLETHCRRMARTCIMVRALIVESPGVPGEGVLVLDPQAGLQGYPFARPALAQKPHLADLYGKHRAAILDWVQAVTMWKPANCMRASNR